MPRILLEKDNLDERNAEFAQAPLREPVFLNSVPKSGTHLLRNIMRMFVPVPQHYTALFIQIASIRQHGPIAFDRAKPSLSWGHLLFDDEPSILLRDVRHILLVRDPHTWVLARARFYLSENFDGRLQHIKGGAVNINDLLNMMIFGVYKKAPGMEETYRHNACAWLGSSTYLVRYEDLVAAVKALDTLEAQVFFFRLFEACGIDPPDDWRTRVRIGSDRKQSSTARENLAGGDIKLPDELPDIQKRLIEYAAPGLRELLGYTSR